MTCADGYSFVGDDSQVIDAGKKCTLCTGKNCLTCTASADTCTTCAGDGVVADKNCPAPADPKPEGLTDG